MVEMDEHTSYTKVPTRIFRDKRIPLSAKAMYAIICSCPPDWDYSIRGFESMLKECRGAIGRYLSLLEATGYIKRIYQRGHDSKYLSAEYIALSEPKADLPYTDNPPTVNPVCGKPVLGKTESRITGARFHGDGK